MRSLHYSQGKSQALTKLGLAATTEHLLPRLLKRMAMGAGVGAITSGIAGGDLAPGAMLGAGGGLLVGSLASRRNGLPTNNAKVDARVERLHRYLNKNTHSPMGHSLREQALNRDLTLGALGGVGGGLVGPLVSRPSVAPQEPAYSTAY